MRKLIKYGLRALAVLVLLFLLATLAGWIYLSRNKQKIISYIRTEAGKSLNGDISIGDIHIAFLQTFPKISISIDNLHLRDSLWSTHHHDLADVQKLYASMDIFQLLTGRLRVNRLTADNAFFYIYADTSGYTNLSIFRKKQEAGANPVYRTSYPEIEFRNASFIVEQKNKNKFFSFDISRLFCKIRPEEDPARLNLDVTLTTQVKSLAFNLSKGSFIEGKNVVGHFPVHYNLNSRILQFDKINLRIDQQLFNVSGKFFLAEKPALFLISLETKNLPYKKAVSFLSENIRSKLSQYDIADALSTLHCTLDGTDSGYRTPLIRLQVNVQRKHIHTPITDLDKASFEGSFTNEEIKGIGHEDENSMLRFLALSAEWQGIGFHSDSVIIRDLLHPAMSCNIKSRFRLTGFNSLFDEGSFRFSRGMGSMAMQFKGPLTGGDDMNKWLNGELDLDSASFTYIPRDFELNNGSGKIRFLGTDMRIEGLHVNTGNTDLEINGSMQNLFSINNKLQGPVSLDWNIRSNRINGNDFRAFLKKRTTGGPVKKKKKLMISDMVEHITQMLESASMNLDLQAKQLSYNRFEAKNLKAVLRLDEDAIGVKLLRLEHAGGSIEAQGELRNDPHSNPLTFHAGLNKVDVAGVLDAFNNFGQTAITSKNISGQLSADINLRGEVTQKGQLIADSTRGVVDFSLTDGRLFQFEPVEKISQTIFKNRNFSDIKFAELKDRFEINGNNITINRMEIRSTAMTMFVEGQYNMKKGADLSIQVPLSNLKGQDQAIAPENRGIDSKTGPSARLRAKTGDDGKLKISWDPFKKAVKKMKKEKS